ncbi:MAG: hypothetical protein RBT80_03210 [Candidatus Vecturithrix sp.]|jgi:uncharacterized membrane protein YcjF (UPF0283 family)|nr:hypothetical protein [Candidatus Vecturithrix sp.]
MKEVLEYVIDAWNQAGFSDIAGYLSVLLAALGVLLVLWKFFARLWNIRQQRKLRQDLYRNMLTH